MTNQKFLHQLDKKLWTAADKLRSNLDAAVYNRVERDRSREGVTQRVDAEVSINHSVLGLIFLKYVSDSFPQRQAEIAAMLKNPENDFFLDPAGYDQPAQYLRRVQRASRVKLRRKQPNQSNPTTWRLAAMNMAIRGIDFDFGKEPADTFTRDQHPDLREEFVMANPPFNIKEWWDGKLEGDAHWSRSEAETAQHARFYKTWGKYGRPPQGNANFAWVQHMLHHLAPNGSMALLLANSSMSSNSSGEGETSALT